MISAAAIRSARRVELEQVDLPAPGAGEVQIEVEACGICGTNVQAWLDPALEAEPGASARPGANGHEVVGLVRSAGAGVDGLGVGDRVCVEPLLATACGSCAPCAEGRPWHCRDRTTLPVWGFAEAMTLPARGALAVPAGAAVATASLAEPLACGVHAVRSSWTARSRGGVLDGCSVAILGAGVTGLLALVAARELGAGSVSVLARHDQQARLAAELGADEVLRESEPEALRRRRPELVIEAVGGRAATFELALDVVARGGEVAVLGLFEEPQHLDPRRALLRELRLGFPVGYATFDGMSDFSVALEILGRRHAELDRLVSHRFPLAEIASAFASAADKRTGSLRVVVQS